MKHISTRIQHRARQARRKVKARVFSKIDRQYRRAVMRWAKQVYEQETGTPALIMTVSASPELR